jgi:hypothetical protein
MIEMNIIPILTRIQQTGHAHNEALVYYYLHRMLTFALFGFVDLESVLGVVHHVAMMVGKQESDFLFEVE